VKTLENLEGKRRKGQIKGSAIYLGSYLTIISGSSSGARVFDGAYLEMREVKVGKCILVLLG
jgi:hypothetical protein